MSFLDDLQWWLAAHKDGRASLEGIDLTRMRNAVWDALERLEGEEQEEAHALWFDRTRIDHATRYVVAALRLGPAGRCGSVELDRLVEDTLGLLVDSKSELGDRSSLLNAEVIRVANDLDDVADDVPSLFDVNAFCEVLGLLNEGELTWAGHLVLGLRGRERVAFLLELQVRLSEGRLDPYRASMGLLEELIVMPVAMMDGDDVEEAALPLLGWIGVCYERVDGTWALEPELVDVVESVTSPDSPLKTLAGAALDELRSVDPPNEAGSSPGGDLRFTAMMLHEVKNILLPLGNSLERLWTELDRSDGRPDPERISELRGRIGRSVDRLQDFTAESASLIAAVPVETLSLAEVVRDAVRATEPDRNGRITVDLTGLLDGTIEGARTRWVLLFVNLLRNAAQSRAGKGTVWIEGARTAGGSLVVHVDDDGAGVPEELREQIFARGVSLKGGSGLGLADARLTVQQSGGTLVCTSSPERGGARFTITVPVRSLP